MDRTERFYKIEMLIRSRGCVSFAEMREVLEVSPATLKRDLQYLRERMDAPSGAGSAMSCRACGSARRSCTRC